MTMTDSRNWREQQAEFLASRGYTIAGFAGDLYEGAEFFIAFAGHPLGSDDWYANSTFGRVLEVVLKPSQRKRWWQSKAPRNQNDNISLVYLNEDGTQVPYSVAAWVVPCYIKYDPKGS